MRTNVKALGVGLAIAAIAGNAAAHDRPGAYWRTVQAESIASIRGMPMRVHDCRGLGRAVVADGVRRYRHFRCVAGARAPWEEHDTVAVLFVLHPLSPYVGRRSRHAFSEVRFIGGPGVP